MVSVCISHVPKAIASAPSWSRGCSAFLRTWLVPSNDGELALCLLLVGQCVEFKHPTAQVDSPKDAQWKYPLWWLVIHSVSWENGLFLFGLFFSFECFCLHLRISLRSLQLAHRVKNEVFSFIAFRKKKNHLMSTILASFVVHSIVFIS